MPISADLLEPKNLLEAAKLVRLAFADGGSHLERIYALSKLDKQIQKSESENFKAA